MFQELNDYYDEVDQRNNAQQAGKNNNNEQQRHLNVINAELLLYRQEPSIRLYNTIEGDGGEEECTFNFILTILYSYFKLINYVFYQRSLSLNKLQRRRKNIQDDLNQITKRKFGLN